MRGRNVMSQPDPKIIKPVRVPAPKPKEGEEVFQVQGTPIVVAPGDTVEILLSSSKGFSVYLPFGGHFDAQVFEAVENPAWAMEEMAAAAGGSMKSSGDTFWGVRMTRISKAGEYEPEVFPYCIYSKELKTFAVGNSPPTMTLKP
jgi:hypothetical protein